MRRVLLIACVATSAWLLTGCSSDDGGNDAPAPQQEAGADAQSEAEPGDAPADQLQEAAEDAPADVLPDQAEAGPKKAAGEVCAANAECTDGLCSGLWDAPANKSCTKKCAADADCNLGGGFTWGCANQACRIMCPSGDSSECKIGLCVENLDLGGAEKRNACYDLRGKLCTKESDCTGDARCTPTSGGKDILWYCSDAPVGTLKTGEACDPNLGLYAPCNTDADCSNGLTCGTQKTCDAALDKKCAAMVCDAEGVCWGACAADADCPADFVCAGIAFTVGRNDQDPTNDMYAPASMCTPFAGSKTACVKDADCPVDEKCSWYILPDGVTRTACARPAADAVAYGQLAADDPHTPVKEDTKPCASKVMFNSICSAICAADADCGSSQQCLKLYGGWAETSAVAVCIAAACQSNADCAAGLACFATGSSPDGASNFCAPEYGDIPAGGTCDPKNYVGGTTPCISDAGCASLGAGWACDLGRFACTPPDAAECSAGFWNCSSDGKCSSACAAHADCGDPAVWQCELTPLTQFQNGTVDPTDDLYTYGGLCRVLSGTRTACTKDADCTTAGEACRLTWSLTGVLASVCAAKVPNGLEAGAACDLAGLCASNMCDLNDGDNNPAKGTCASRCAADADCTAPLTCQDLLLTGDGKNKLKYCRKPAAGGFGG